MNDYNEDFWNALDELVNTSEIVIDRPKGSAHPRFPDFIYRVDYGYLRDTSSMDGLAVQKRKKWKYIKPIMKRSI